MAISRAYFPFFSPLSNNTYDPRRHSSVSFIKNGDAMNTSASNVNLKLGCKKNQEKRGSSSNSPPSCIGRSNGEIAAVGNNSNVTKAKTDIIEDFDTLIKEHEQYGLKEFNTIDNLDPKPDIDIEKPM